MDPGTDHDRRILTAFFDDKASAEGAVRDLFAAGFETGDVGIVSSDEDAPSQDAGGFWTSLRELLLPREDHAAFAEGLRRGGYLVSVSARGDNHGIAAGILDRDGAVDIETRQAEWQREGWQPEPGTAPEESALANPTARERLEAGPRFRAYRVQETSPEPNADDDALETSAGEEAVDDKDKGIDRRTRPFGLPGA